MEPTSIFCPLPKTWRVDIAGDPDSDVAPPLQKALLGFTSPSFADGGEPIIRTAFRDRRTDGTCEDLIGESEFFTRYDYENADHQMNGKIRRIRAVQGQRIRVRRNRERPRDQLGRRERASNDLRSLSHQVRRGRGRCQAFDPSDRRAHPHGPKDEKNRWSIHLPGRSAYTTLRKHGLRLAGYRAATYQKRLVLLLFVPADVWSR